MSLRRPCLTRSTPGRKPGYDGTPAPAGSAPATATPALPGYSDPFSDSNAWATLGLDTPLDYAVD